MTLRRLRPRVALLGMLIAAASAGCRKSSEPTSGRQPERSAARGDVNTSTERPTAPPNAAASSELLSDDLIERATFVPLDFARFPRLPARKPPAGGFVAVGKSGAAHASIGAALAAAEPGSIVVVSRGQHHRDPGRQ